MCGSSEDIYTKDFILKSTVRSSRSEIGYRHCPEITTKSHEMEKQALLPYRDSETGNAPNNALMRPNRDYTLFKILAFTYVAIHFSIWFFLSDSTPQVFPHVGKQEVQHSMERIWRFTDVRRVYHGLHGPRYELWNFLLTLVVLPSRLNPHGI